MLAAETEAARRQLDGSCEALRVAKREGKQLQAGLEALAANGENLRAEQGTLLETVRELQAGKVRMLGEVPVLLGCMMSCVLGARQPALWCRDKKHPRRMLQTRPRRSSVRSARAHRSAWTQHGGGWRSARPAVMLMWRCWSRRSSCGSCRTPTEPCCRCASGNFHLSGWLKTGHSGIAQASCACNWIMASYDEAEMRHALACAQDVAALAANEEDGEIIAALAAVGIALPAPGSGPGSACGSRAGSAMGSPQTSRPGSAKSAASGRSARSSAAARPMRVLQLNI